MAAPQRVDELIQSYFNGVLSDAEFAELVQLLVVEPAAADAFAHAARLDALLDIHFKEEHHTAQWRREAPAAVPPRKSWRVRTALTIVATAAAIVIVFALQSGQKDALELAENRCTSGRVLVDGVESTVIPDGAQVTVVGSSAADIRLKDGNEMTLAPATSVVIDADEIGSTVSLDYGQASFHMPDTSHALRVSTPAGAVSGRAAEFAVESQATESAGISAVGSNALALLTVAVLAGQVEVQQANENVKISAGESRAFAPEKKPVFSGRVIRVADDGARIILEGKPPKPGVPPPQREVLVTSGTDIEYFGIAKDGDHPTVGYLATAFLDPASPEAALAIEFGSKAASLNGIVREVSADGSKITVEMYRKNDAPVQCTVSLTERTRVSYAGVEPGGEKPTVGYVALVWLADGGDEATEIRLVWKGKKSALKDQPQQPDKKKSPPERKPGEPKNEKLQGEKPIDKKLPATEASKDQPPKKKPPIDKSSLPAEKSPKPDAPKPAKGATSKSAKPADTSIASVSGGKALAPPVARRPATRNAPAVSTAIDAEIRQRLANAKVSASPPADDAEFLRRAYLDITGAIPSAAAAAQFLDSSDADKRTQLIDNLLANPAYGRRFAAVWKRLISPRPANSGKPQVDKFTPWLADQFNQNQGWNEIVHELLITDVNIAREPNGFFLAANSESLEPRPNLLAASTGRLFLGVQLGCAECHNHPFASWKQTEFWSFAAFFSRLHKRSKAEFILVEEPFDPAMPIEVKIPPGGQSGGETVAARFLGNVEPQWRSAVEARHTLADWVTSRDNQFFARATVNRLWAHFFSRGLVEPLDGFQEGHTASHPETLDRLAAEFIDSDFDLQHIIRVICNTAAYGRTSRPHDDNAQDAELLSHMAVKALNADVLYDVLAMATGSNGMPDPSAKGGKSLGVPPRDAFINFFAGPAADASSHQYSLGIPQLLRLMNADEYNLGSPLARSLAASDATPDDRVTTLYLAVLSRRPTDGQRQLLVDFVSERKHSEQAYSGALWMLLNSSEFVLNR